jgi:hypothetical protein
MTPNHPEDRSLVRRLNFLGFPEEKRGGLSYGGLKAELGDDDAAKLVTRIEELLIKQGLESLGVLLSSALSRIVQSLTPDERRTMAQEGVVPAHVQTRVSAEIATARLQQSQTPMNVHGAGHLPEKAALERSPGAAGFAGAGKLSNRDAPGARSEAGGSYSGSVGSVTQENFGFTPFAASGMSYATFNYLRTQGFGETNILHAAQDAKLAGFDPNDRKIANAFSVLDKDDGKRRDERNSLLERFDERLQHDETFQSLKAQREQAKTNGDRARLDRQLDQRGREISEDVGFHKHVETAPTARGREAGRLIEQQKIKQRAHDRLSELAPKDGAKAKQIAESMDQARRNDDQRALDKTLDKYAAASVDDRQKRTAIAGLRKELEKDKKLKTAQKKDNEIKSVEGTAKQEVKNSRLALLNDDSDTEKPVSAPVQKAASKPTNETEKSPSKPTRLVVATSKNNGPTAGA